MHQNFVNHFFWQAAIARHHFCSSHFSPFSWFCELSINRCSSDVLHFQPSFLSYLSMFLKALQNFLRGASGYSFKMIRSIYRTFISMNLNCTVEINFFFSQFQSQRTHNICNAPHITSHANAANYRP